MALVFVFTQVLGMGGSFLYPSSNAEAQVSIKLEADAILATLPPPGSMVTQTPEYIPLLLKGIKIHPNDAFRFNFIIDTGHSNLKEDKLKDQSTRLIKYFLASLTIPEDSLWVNLSPYEKDRIISEDLGDTEMGRDLLAQDYILKQLTASLIYPEDDLGDMFWEKIYTRAYEMYGTTEIPMNTFNKIWIVPEKAVVYENGNQAYVVESHLKVMLEEDYLSLKNNLSNNDIGTDQVAPSEVTEISNLSSGIVKEIILPAIEKEVNEGKNFAQLRQIYHSMILALWFKRNLKESLLSRLYVDQNKIQGIDLADKNVKQKIYDQYITALKKGVYDYIREDYDPNTRQVIPRKYFSGGFELPAGFSLTEVSTLPAKARPTGQLEELEVAFSRVAHEEKHDQAGFALVLNLIWAELQQAAIEVKVSPTGELDFRSALKGQPGQRVDYSRGPAGQERFLELTEDDILVIVDDRFNLDHVGRDRRMVFARSQEKVSHELKELKDWEAYWEEFWTERVWGKGIVVPDTISSSGVGTRIKFWANDESASPQERAQRQSQLIKEFYRFHAHGLIAEGKDAEGQWILNNLDKLPALQNPIEGFDFFIASTATLTDPALFDENKSVIWEEYISYRKLFNSDPEESGDVKNFMTRPQDFKKVVENNLGESEPAKIESLITRQAPLKQSVVELVANASDAIIRAMAEDEVAKAKSYPIGRFGMGGMQMQAFVLNKIKPILNVAAHIIINTRAQDGTANKIIFFKGADGRIRFNITPGDRKTAGTTVHIRFPAGMARGQRAVFEQELLRRLNLFTRMRVYLNDRLLNRLDDHIFLNGQMVNYDFPESLIQVRMTDNEIIVEDQGDGMSDEIIRDKYLIPRLGENEEERQPQTEAEIEREVHLFYKGPRSYDREETSRIVFQVAGINIQSVEVQGYGLPADLVIQLPSSTELTLARDKIEIDESTHTAVKILAQKIIEKDPIHQIELMNGFIQAVRILDEQNARIEALPPLLHTAQEVFAPFILEKKALTLPNDRLFRQIQVPEKTLFLDQDIIYQISPGQIPGAQDISHAFRPGRMKKAYTVPFKEGADVTFLGMGPYLLINQRIYEMYKKFPLFLNLRFNYYQGYGRRSASRGWLLSEKEIEEKQVQESQVLPILQEFPTLRSVITDGQVEFLRMYLDSRAGKPGGFPFDPDVDASEESLKKLFAKLDAFAAQIPEYIRQTVAWRWVFPFHGDEPVQPKKFEQLLKNPDLVMMTDVNFLMLNKDYFLNKEGETRLGRYLWKLLFASPLAYLDDQTTVHKIISQIDLKGLAAVDDEIVTAVQTTFGRRKLEDFEEAFKAINAGIPHVADQAGIKRLILRWLRIYKNEPKSARLFYESLSKGYEREVEEELLAAEAVKVPDSYSGILKDTFKEGSFTSLEFTGLESQGKPVFVSIRKEQVSFYRIDQNTGGIQKFGGLPMKDKFHSVVFTGEFENGNPIFIALAKAGVGPQDRFSLFTLDLNTGGIVLSLLALGNSLKDEIEHMQPTEWNIKDTGITGPYGAHLLSLALIKEEGERSVKKDFLVHFDRANASLQYYGGSLKFSSDTEFVRQHEVQYIAYGDKLIAVDDSGMIKPRFHKFQKRWQSTIEEIKVQGTIGRAVSEGATGLGSAKTADLRRFSHIRLLHKDEDGNLIFAAAEAPIGQPRRLLALFSLNPESGQVKNIEHDFLLGGMYTAQIVDIKVLEQGPQPVVALTHTRYHPRYSEDPRIVQILKIDILNGKIDRIGQLSTPLFEDHNPSGLAYDKETKTLAVRTVLKEVKPVMKESFPDLYPDKELYPMFAFDLSPAPSKPKGFAPLPGREHSILQTGKLDEAEAEAMIYDKHTILFSPEAIDFTSIIDGSAAGFKKGGKQVFVLGEPSNKFVDFFTWDTATQKRDFFASYPFERRDDSKVGHIKAQNTGLKDKNGNLIFVAYENWDFGCEIQFFTINPDTGETGYITSFLGHEKHVDYVRRVPGLDDHWQGHPAFESYSYEDDKAIIFTLDMEDKSIVAPTEVQHTGDTEPPVSLNTERGTSPVYIKISGNKILLGHFAKGDFVMIFPRDIDMGQKIDSVEPLFVQDQEGRHAVLVRLGDGSYKFLLYNPDTGGADTIDGTEIYPERIRPTGLFTPEGMPIFFFVNSSKAVLVSLDLDKKIISKIKEYTAEELVGGKIKTKHFGAGAIKPEQLPGFDSGKANIDLTETWFLRDSGTLKVRVKHPMLPDHDIFINFTQAELIEKKPGKEISEGPKGFSPVQEHQVLKLENANKAGLIIEDKFRAPDVWEDAYLFGEASRAGFKKDGGEVYASPDIMNNKIQFFTWDGGNQKRRVFADYKFERAKKLDVGTLHTQPTNLKDEDGRLIFVAYETTEPGHEIQFFTLDPDTGQTELLVKVPYNEGPVKSVRRFEVPLDNEGNPIVVVQYMNGRNRFLGLRIRQKDLNSSLGSMMLEGIKLIPLGVELEGKPVYASRTIPKIIDFLTVNNDITSYWFIHTLILQDDVAYIESLGVQDNKGNQVLLVRYLTGKYSFLLYNPGTNETSFIEPQDMQNWSSIPSLHTVTNTRLFTQNGEPIFVSFDKKRILFYSVDFTGDRFNLMEELYINDIVDGLNEDVVGEKISKTDLEIDMDVTDFLDDLAVLKLGIRNAQGSFNVLLNYNLPWIVEVKKVAKTDLKKVEAPKKRFRSGFEMLAPDDDLSGLPTQERMIIRFLKEEDVTLLNEEKTDARRKDWQTLERLDEPLSLAFMNYLHDKRAKTIGAKPDITFEEFLQMARELKGKNLKDYIKIIRKATQGQDKTQRSWIREVAVQNARDATRRSREQGQLAKEQGEIVIRNFTEGNDWVFSVRDTGTGMNLWHLLRFYFPLDQSSKKQLEDTGNLGQGNYTLFADFDRVFIRTSIGDGIINELEIINDPAQGPVISSWEVLQGNYRGTEVRRVKRRDKGDPQLESLFIQEALVNFAAAISSPEEKRKKGLEPDIRDVKILYNGEPFSEGIDFDQSSSLGKDMGTIALGRSKLRFRTRVVQDGILVKTPDEAELKYVPRWLKIAYERFGGMHISLPREVLLNIPRTGYLLEEEPMHQLQVAVLHNIMKAVLRDYVEKGAKIPAMPSGYFDHHQVIDRETAQEIAIFMHKGEYDKITEEMLEPYLQNPARFFELLSYIPFISKAYEGPMNLHEIREILMEKSNLRSRRKALFDDVRGSRFNANFRAIGEFAADISESFGHISALGNGEVGGRLRATVRGRRAEELPVAEVWKTLAPNAQLIVDFFSRRFIQPVVGEEMPRFGYRNKRDNASASTMPGFNTIFWNLAWQQGMIKTLVTLSQDREVLRAELQKGEESDLWRFLETLIHESQHLSQFEEPGDHTHHDADQIEGYEDINDPRFGVRMGRAFDRMLAELSDDVLGEFNRPEEEMRAFVAKYENAPSRPYARPQDDDAWRADGRTQAEHQRDQESSSNETRNPGGIDLDPGMMELEIRGEGTMFALPQDSPQFEDIRIDGLFPVIINITPVHNLPLYLGAVGIEPDSLVYSR